VSRIGGRLRVALFEEPALVGDRLLARQAGLRMRCRADRVREARYELEAGLDVGGIA